MNDFAFKMKDSVFKMMNPGRRLFKSSATGIIASSSASTSRVTISFASFCFKTGAVAGFGAESRVRMMRNCSGRGRRGEHGAVWLCRYRTRLVRNRQDSVQNRPEMIDLFTKAHHS